MTGPVRGPRARLLLIAPAAVVLILGLTAGLLLLGLRVPLVTERLPDLHAPLMVFGFVGTLISLERAVALRAAWAYTAPLLLVSGAVLTVSPLPLFVGQVLIVVGSAVHLTQYRAIWLRQPATATAIQALGAASALVASIAWSGGVSAAPLVPLLAVFLVLTIAGERLELARVAAPGRAAERWFFGGAFALAAAAVLSLTAPGVAVPAAGAILIGVAAWLIRFDVARVTVHQRGLARYVAVNLLLGYGWLIVAGTGWLLGGARTEGPLYDATTHAIFLGFVITLIMAHAPLILPAVLRVRIPYHPALYAPVAVLHLALLVRVVIGDAWGSVLAVQIGGVGGIVAMVAFALTVVIVATRTRSQEREDHDVTT
jgi:hypothetical protein